MSKFNAERSNSYSDWLVEHSKGCIKITPNCITLKKGRETIFITLDDVETTDSEVLKFIFRIILKSFEDEDSDINEPSGIDNLINLSILLMDLIKLWEDSASE